MSRRIPTSNWYNNYDTGFGTEVAVDNKLRKQWFQRNDLNYYDEKDSNYYNNITNTYMNVDKNPYNSILHDNQKPYQRKQVSFAEDNEKSNKQPSSFVLNKKNRINAADDNDNKNYNNILNNEVADTDKNDKKVQHKTNYNPDLFYKTTLNNNIDNLTNKYENKNFNIKNNLKFIKTGFKNKSDNMSDVFNYCLNEDNYTSDQLEIESRDFPANPSDHSYQELKNDPNHQTVQDYYNDNRKVDETNDFYKENIPQEECHQENCQNNNCPPDDSDNNKEQQDNFNNDYDNANDEFIKNNTNNSNNKYDDNNNNLNNTNYNNINNNNNNQNINKCDHNNRYGHNNNKLNIYNQNNTKNNFENNIEQSNNMRNEYIDDFSNDDFDQKYKSANEDKYIEGGEEDIESRSNSNHSSEIDNYNNNNFRALEQRDHEKSCKQFDSKNYNEPNNDNYNNINQLKNMNDNFIDKNIDKNYKKEMKTNSFDNMRTLGIKNDHQIDYSPNDQSKTDNNNYNNNEFFRKINRVADNRLRSYKPKKSDMNSLLSYEYAYNDQSSRIGPYEDNVVATKISNINNFNQNFHDKKMDQGYYQSYSNKSTTKLPSISQNSFQYNSQKIQNSNDNDSDKNSNNNEGLNNKGRSNFRKTSLSRQISNDQKPEFFRLGSSDIQSQQNIYSNNRRKTSALEGKPNFFSYADDEILNKVYGQQSGPRMLQNGLRSDFRKKKIDINHAIVPRSFIPSLRK